MQGQNRRDPARPMPGQPTSTQMVPGRPIPGQPIPGQPVTGQPIPGQPVAGGDPVAIGYQWGANWRPLPAAAPAPTAPAAANRLEAFFDERKIGRGIWKWRHYFEIYERHFRRFCNTPVHVLEIGLSNGGSLEMWQDYFGPKARVYGVDVDPQCRAYATETVKVFTGNQGDRRFWQDFRRQVPQLDIVIDDGGHDPLHQTISLQELLPHLRPGGVYLCEDVTETAGPHPFASFVHGMAHRLNDFSGFVADAEDDERRLVCSANPFQRAVGSVHLYPYVVVVERNRVPVAEFVAPRHGSNWQS